MKLTVVGSGTLLPSADRASPCHYLEGSGGGEGPRILLDCGSGGLHGLARLGLPWTRLSHVALSHFHADHIGDLAPLLFALKHGARRSGDEPLRLLGPTGIRSLHRRLADAFGEFVLDPGFPVEVEELAPGGALPLDGGCELRCGDTLHTEESVAYRIDGPEGAFGYTGDAGYTDELAAFLTGVDVLVAECGIEDPPALDTHLSPSGVARLAMVARPGVLVLTHAYPPLEPETLPARVRAAGYEGEVVAAADGLTVPVGKTGSP